MENKKLLFKNYLLTIERDSFNDIDLHDVLDEKINISINTKPFTFTNSGHLLTGDEFKEVLKSNKYYAFRIYGLIHSDICLSLTPFNYSYDSGVAGLMWVSKSNFKDCKSAFNSLNNAIQVINDYIQGDIYYYRLEKIRIVKKPDIVRLEMMDDCDGFIGDDSLQSNINDILKSYKLSLSDFKPYDQHFKTRVVNYKDI